mmetsp:Transcript_17167/g.25756  ORF Transcript_17167/g.25756 Transcript_17167/m.25756 type:complete len:142 (-) Transcript_17167:647-1072(-)
MENRKRGRILNLHTYIITSCYSLFLQARLSKGRVRVIRLELELKLLLLVLDMEPLFLLLFLELAKEFFFEDLTTVSFAFRELRVLEFLVPPILNVALSFVPFFFADLCGLLSSSFGGYHVFNGLNVIRCMGVGPYLLIVAT